MKDDSLIIQGIEKIVYRSKIFLNEIGEFAPFGIIYKNNEWIDVATYEENINSNAMKNFLIDTINDDFAKGNCLFGGVCVDAKIDDIGDVIIIYNSSDGDDWFELVYRYFTDEKGQVVIENKSIY